MLILSGLFGALSGAAITFFFNMWKFHRDERNSRSDELCKAIWDAAALSADYWGQVFKLIDSQKIAEAKIFAAQIMIDGLFEDFRIFLSEEKEISIDQNLSDLIDVLTGGDYSVIGRKTDMVRAAKAAPIASEIIVLLRRAHRETMPFHQISTAYHRNKRRKLDMPVLCGGEGWKDAPSNS